MKKLLLCLLAITISFYTLANNDVHTGTIKGLVKTSDNKAAQGVTIRVVGTNRNTVTDEDGKYIFNEVVAGHYYIEASLVGHGSVTLEIDIAENKTAVANFDFPLSEKDLQDVIVTTNQHTYTKDQSNYVAKMPLKNVENPQVYTTVTKQLISDQLLTSADDAMRNVSGIQPMWQATGRSGDGGAYYNLRGFAMQSKLRNGLAGIVSNTTDAANLESIEVIKGPSGALFGSVLTSYGGLINRVTKKPYDTFGGEVSEMAGSYDFSRTALDINTPLDKAKKVLFRLNTAYNYQGTFQTEGFSKRIFVAPSLLIKANDRLTISLDAELSYGRNIGQQLIFFYFPVAELGVSNAKDVKNIDYKNSYMGDGLVQTSNSGNYFGQVNYKISSNWASSTNVSFSHSYSNGMGPYFYLVPNIYFTGNAADYGKSDYLARADQSTYNNSHANDFEAQQNFNGDFKIGSLRNRLLLGLDYTRIGQHIFFRSNTSAFDVVPLNVQGFDYNGFNGTSVQNYYARNMNTDSVQTYPETGTTNDYSAYASDVLSVTDKLSVLAALRVDHFDNFNNGVKLHQTVLSPKFGIVYQPVLDAVSLFVNYQNSFTNGSFYQALNEDTIVSKLSKPQQANQWEAGVKTNLINNNLTATLSVYDIKVKDMLRTDYSAIPLNAQIQNGTQVSKGVELELNANPFKGFDMLGGFSYNDSKMEKADSAVLGRRAATASSPWLAHWWLSYSLSENSALKGVRFGFGGNYASDNKIVNDANNGVFTLPAYTVLNAAVTYEINKLRLGFKADNLTNKHYWIGYSTMAPQMLRQFVASVSYKF
ncbi:MAG TPA: TonB-dependent receptor [Arachidicoccus sp.]